MNGSLWLRSCESDYRGHLDKERVSRSSRDKSDSTVEILGQSPTLVSVQGRWLSPSLIDSLAENQQDWVSLLQHDWEMEIYGFSLLGVQCDEKCFKRTRLMIQDFVALTLQSTCQCLNIFQQLHWYYSCCLQVVGLGRVRVVISFDDPQKAGGYAVLFCNRLDWSPRSVLSRWLEKNSVSTLYGATNVSLIQQSGLSAIL